MKKQQLCNLRDHMAREMSTINTLKYRKKFLLNRQRTWLYCDCDNAMLADHVTEIYACKKLKPTTGYAYKRKLFKMLSFTTYSKIIEVREKVK